MKKFLPTIVMMLLSSITSTQLSASEQSVSNKNTQTMVANQRATTPNAQGFLSSWKSSLSSTTSSLVETYNKITPDVSDPASLESLDSDTFKIITACAMVALISYGIYRSCPYLKKLYARFASKNKRPKN